MEVVGRFDVELSVPIEVSPDLDPNELADIKFEDESYRVLLRASSVIRWDEEEGPYAAIDKVWVSITRKEKLDAQGLTSKVKSEFLIELQAVVVSFVLAAQGITSQSTLDIRHPIRLFQPSYDYQDGTPPEIFLVSPGTWFTPPDLVDASVFEISSGQPLGPDSWQRLEQAMGEADSISPYQRRIWDAQEFLRQLQYDAAVLYVAFAVEEILNLICKALIPKRLVTPEEKSNVLHDSRKGRWPKGGLRRLSLQELNEYSNLLLGKWTKYKSEIMGYPHRQIVSLFKCRNSIAHRGRRNFNKEDAIKALSTAQKLKKVLESVSQLN